MHRRKFLRDSLIAAPLLMGNAVQKDPSQSPSTVQKLPRRQSIHRGAWSSIACSFTGLTNMAKKVHTSIPGIFLYRRGPAAARSGWLLWV